MMHEAILDARESRFKYIQSVILKQHVSVILVKANIPGLEKNIIEAHLLVRIFSKVILKEFKIISHETHTTCDGDYIIHTIKEDDSIGIKKKLIKIESEHPLGRLIDLDLYVGEAYAVSRVSLSLTPRPCYLCAQDARICSKNQTHTEKELITYVKSSYHQFMNQHILNVINQSMMLELNLEDKFGLVTPTSSGSHKDMSYSLMLKAKDAILPFFLQMFDLGFYVDDLDQAFQKSRLIGMIAEEKMRQATDQVNCYKGLIFILGITLVACGHALKQKNEIDTVFGYVSHMTRDITSDYSKKMHTFGEIAYQKYQMKGARGEAISGLPSVKFGIHFLENHELSDTNLRVLLKEIALQIEDTVLLKRSRSMEFYHQVKLQLKKTDVTDSVSLKKFNQFCISNNLSFGGAADLLVTSLFLNQLKSFI